MPPASRFAAKLGLAALTMVVTLALCELVARAIFPAPSDPARQPQVVYLFDPEIGYVHKPNQEGWIDAGYAAINSMGFRGGEVASPKPAGRYRIAVIGDSVTLGMGVADDETYAAQVERLLRAKYPSRDLDVVNLGVSGYNTRQAVALLSRHAAALQPDLVLLGFYANDVADALEGDRGAGGTTIAAKGMVAGQELKMNPDRAPQWQRTLRKIRLAYLLGRAIKSIAGGGERASAAFAIEQDLLEGRDTPVLNDAWAKVEKQLRGLHTLADAAGFVAGVVALPSRVQVAGSYPGARYQSRLQALAEANGLFLIDPLPSLAGSGIRSTRLYIPYDIHHPSAVGHQLIAESIVDVASRKGWLR